MSTENKTIVEDIQRSLTDLRAKSEEGLKDVVRTDELKRIEDHLDTQIKGLQEALAAQNTIGASDERSDNEFREKQAIGEYFLKGDKAYDGPVRNGKVEIKADSGVAAITVANQGGVVLPKVFNDMVDPIVRKTSPLRDMAKVVRANQGFVTPIKTSKGVAGRRTEFGALTQSNAPTYDLMSHSFIEINGTEAVTVWADLNTNSVVDTPKA